LNRRPPAPKAALYGTGNPALPVPFLCSPHIAKDCCGLSSRNGTLVSPGWATTAAQEIDAAPSCQDRPARVDAQEDSGAATVGTLERGGYTRVSSCGHHFCSPQGPSISAHPRTEIGLLDGCVQRKSAQAVGRRPPDCRSRVSSPRIGLCHRSSSSRPAHLAAPHRPAPRRRPRRLILGDVALVSALDQLLPRLLAVRREPPHRVDQLAAGHDVLQPGAAIMERAGGEVAAVAVEQVERHVERRRGDGVRVGLTQPPEPEPRAEPQLPARAAQANLLARAREFDNLARTEHAHLERGTRCHPGQPVPDLLDVLLRHNGNVVN